MPAPTTSEEFVELIRKSGVVEPQALDAYLEELRAAGAIPPVPKMLATLLVRDGILTYFQAEQILVGKWRGFKIGKYQILERLGSGGMGVVYLGEHKLMRRRVAIKVLPITLAEDPWFLEYFYREAQAVAALDHPNIVRAHDIDRDGNLHFLVMEYVDGSSLQSIITKNGPMAVARVPHYLWQAAWGLQHAHEVGLVHRDIKPGNLLLDRQGTIKILDMGLAYFAKKKQEQAVTSQGEGKRIVGTDDYLAPEQIVNSDDVDIRADIYSLGAMAYFLLTGNPPFYDVDLDHHKLIWHLTRQPKPLRDLRPEVPEAFAAIVEKMMAKNPWQRFQTPAAVARALDSWIRSPIGPPPESEMPGLSLAAQRCGSLPASPSSAARRSVGRSSWIIYNGGQGGSPSSGFLSDLAQARTQTAAGGSATTHPSANARRSAQQNGNVSPSPNGEQPALPDQQPSQTDKKES